MNGFKVIPCTRNHISDFIIKNHYSGSINGCSASYCFALMSGDKMIGAAFFGRLAMVNQWKPYAEKEQDVIELRRLCCIDETPKNTESFFIGAMLRWLKKNTDLKCVLSYADEEHGHVGTIYRASNFKYLGKTAGAPVIIYKGKQYHDKALRTKYNGKLKPFSQRLKDAYDRGEAMKKKTAGKHIYLYKLRKEKNQETQNEGDS